MLLQPYQNLHAPNNESTSHLKNPIQNALDRHSFQDRNKEVLQQIQEHLNPARSGGGYPAAAPYEVQNAD